MTRFTGSLRRGPLVLIAALLWLPPAVFGQSARGAQTRAEAHEQAQAERAAAVSAPSLNRFERWFRTAESIGLFGGTQPGLRPTVTTIYPGGWLAAGGGFRRPLGRIDHAMLDVNAAWSLRNFKKLQGSLSVPLPSGRRPWLRTDLDGQWIDAPAVAFYGLGNDTRPEHRVAFSYRPAIVGLTVRTASEAFRAGGGVDFMNVDTGPVLDGSPDAVTIVGQPSALGRNPRYLRTRAFVEIDRRSPPGYTGRGGLYRIELQDHSDRSGSHLGFRSSEAEVVQLVPVLNANWVLAFRGLATVTDDRDDDDVPFYLMPSVGGNNSVRGYSSLRFRGNHRLLLSAEYRWTATRFLDMALFYDTGKVAMDLARLDLRDLKSAYGIGARFHGTRRTVFRIELARNDERQWRFVWSTGAAF